MALLSVEDSVLMVIDMQGNLYESMQDKEFLLENIRKLIRGMQVFGIPVIVTDYIQEVVKFVVIKNVVFPLIFLALLLLLRPDLTIALIVIIQAAVPPITAIPIFVERCAGNRQIASQFVVASFIFSIFSIPAVIYLFSRFFPIPF